jgi:cytochrome c-type biogenesis protein CcmE
MTRKQRRITLIAAAGVVLVAAAALVLTALQDSIVFFYSPSDIAAKGVGPGERIRLGGLVEDGSVHRGGGQTIRFRVTDTASTIAVTYSGILPDLFREGQGVVAEGELGPDGNFLADTVLAKHDENYMPPEVAAALKDKGVWEGEKARIEGTLEESAE